MTSADLLLGAALGLELDELFGDLVVGSLRQDAQDGPPGLVQLNSENESGKFVIHRFFLPQRLPE